MSALHDAPHRRSGQSKSAPRKRTQLHPVPTPIPPLRHLPFMLVLAGVLGLGMLGLLLLNTNLQDQSFALTEKRSEATRLAYTEADLQQTLAEVSSSRSLAAKATAQGMRPNLAPAFLVMPDGTVVGNPRKATGKEFGTALVKSPAQLERERLAAEAAARKKQEEAEAQKKADAEQRKAEEAEKNTQEQKKQEQEGER